ncbi:nitrile-specifier protein 5 isoform X2 [Selaginella moellendorffii]|uniref:nitrile-specifier protein 5 isoform X2 n=1 Tax=Selaginella moellendorffii TaxID=88036 RepID=UPI000D1CB46C|nr:nitrile-specifier protein 5 isoform X2 [Selaginella moellendorffii]|eukprot:XP_002963370.2 nitrile-specifier protein 5 isoform X2 [Selaginella moellendorffii]
MSCLAVSSEEITQQEGAPKARSSHAVAVVGSKAYVFGGEFEPRVPIDNKVHVFDLRQRSWAVAELRGEIPSARVGVAMAAAGNTIFVFGGRDEQHQELNEFFSFDTVTGEWRLLSAEETSPPHRSYHTLAADKQGKNIYTFGGCGKAGRLNDLWVFNIESSTWKKLPESSTLTPRGGPGLAVVNGAVWVIFGFCGDELTDVHRFDIASQTWEEVQVSCSSLQKPIGRSVFGTSCVGNKIFLYGGEVDPSDLGHLGAGAFTDELLVLDTEKLAWEKPRLEGKHPGARGWYAAAGFENSMLVYGGNSATNDRLDDMFLLSVRA